MKFLKYTIIPIILTWPGWLIPVALYFQMPATDAFFDKMGLLPFIITALLTPFLCLVYDDFRRQTRVSKVVVGFIFSFMNLFLNFLIYFFVGMLLPDIF